MASAHVHSRALEISLRVLNAYRSHTPPAASDEAYLRKLTGDTTTPGDDLACQIIQAELRNRRGKNKVAVAEATADKHLRLLRRHVGDCADDLPFPVLGRSRSARRPRSSIRIQQTSDTSPPPNNRLQWTVRCAARH